MLPCETPQQKGENSNLHRWFQPIGSNQANDANQSIEGTPIVRSLVSNALWSTIITEVYF